MLHVPGHENRDMHRIHRIQDTLPSAEPVACHTSQKTKKKGKMREKNKTLTGKRAAKPDSSAVGKLGCHRVSESLWWQQGVSVARIWMGGTQERRG